MRRIINIKKKKKPINNSLIIEDEDGVKLKSVEDMVWDEFRDSMKTIKKHEKIKKNFIKRSDPLKDVLDK